MVAAEVVIGVKESAVADPIEVPPELLFDVLLYH
jgi:hypothetical protein